MTARCGTSPGYQAHVQDGTQKCAPCRRAHADQRADYRRRRYLRHAPLSVDATGGRRRIQALAAIGWSLAEQSALMGLERSAAHAITTRSWLWPGTAERIRALYDKLAMTPGPSVRARNEAARRGWFPPLAWDDDAIDDPAARPSAGTNLRRVDGRAFDEVAVQRAMHGDAVHLRPVERVEATRRLTRLGYSATQIAERLHTTPRSVQRQRGARSA